MASKDQVSVIVTGPTGCGKSAVYAHIEVALKAMGFDVQHEKPGEWAGELSLAHGHEQTEARPQILMSEVNRPIRSDAGQIECHGLDTPERVCFYEQDFYVLSNFSAFTLQWKGLIFPTLEQAYHWEKFPSAGNAEWAITERIRNAPSAHAAFILAQEHKHNRRHDWDDVKVDIMRELLRAKIAQHEYVRRKLLATGDRELVENSWRDDFWGWGPNRDGQNMLGKLWMEIRAELRASADEVRLAG